MSLVAASRDNGGSPFFVGMQILFPVLFLASEILSELVDPVLWEDLISFGVEFCCDHPRVVPRRVDAVMGGRAHPVCVVINHA